MPIDFEALDQLRAHGVESAEFTLDGSLLAVKFVDPRLIAEAETARLVARQLAEGPADALEQIQRIEKDESIPEFERTRLVTQLKAQLIYGGSR